MLKGNSNLNRSCLRRPKVFHISRCHHQWVVRDRALHRYEVLAGTTETMTGETTATIVTGVPVLVLNTTTDDESPTETEGWTEIDVPEIHTRGTDGRQETMSIATGIPETIDMVVHPKMVGHRHGTVPVLARAVHRQRRSSNPTLETPDCSLLPQTLSRQATDHLPCSSTTSHRKLGSQPKHGDCMCSKAKKISVSLYASGSSVRLTFWSPR